MAIPKEMRKDLDSGQEIVCLDCGCQTVNFFESVEFEGWMCARCWNLKGARDDIVELRESLSTLVLLVGLTAFRHENQRAVLQEAIDQSQNLLSNNCGGG